MKVKDRMIKKITTITPKKSISVAFDFLSKGDLKLLPVVDKDVLVGIIANKDILKYLMLSLDESFSKIELLKKIKVKEVMTTDVKTISPNTTFKEAAEIMSSHKISGLPVVEKGKLVGLITETTIMEEFIG
ncbi:MAG: CBS domain-containing protein [Pseudomonadota bacterium]